MKRWFLALLLAVCAPAFAALPPSSIQYAWGAGYTHAPDWGAGSGVHSTKAAACTAYTQALATFTTAIWRFGNLNEAGHCQYGYSWNSDPATTLEVTMEPPIKTIVSCPANAEPDGSGGCVCKPGSTENNGQCSMPCEQGTREGRAARVGYARATARADGALWRTTDGRSYMAPVAGMPNPANVEAPGVFCDGTCEWVQDSGLQDWWVSNDPGPTGLYSVFKEYTYIRTGGKCTGKTDAMNPDTAPPPCDGYIGTVGGKTTCVAKAPPTSATGQSAPTGPKPTSSPAGSKPTDSGQPRVGPNGETPGKPGDRQGLQDLGGTGTGTDPTGTGTPKPSTTSTGTTTTTTTPTGTQTKIEMDIETCGLPGKPACKIDESGTPSGEGFGNDAKGTLEGEWSKLDQLITGIGSKGDKDTSWAVPSWFSPGACKPWNLGTIPELSVTFSVDLCPHMPMINGILNFMWVVGTFFACLGMISRVMMGPSKM